MRPIAIPALALCLLALVASPPRGWAVVAPASTPADFTGQWTGSNWSTSTVGVFEWMAGSGVAISPYHFLTARHLNTWVGETADINGLSETVLNVKVIHDPATDPDGTGAGTDMALVTVDKPLPMKWETMYNGAYTPGQQAIIIGYGYGGFWGGPYTLPRAERWGTNAYYMSLTLGTGEDGGPVTQGFAMTYRTADTDTQYEAGFSDGDSGGGTFVKVGNRWELAGIDLDVGALASYAGDVSYYYDWIIKNTTIAGDANMDLKVNFSDYLVLEANFGKSNATWDMGDFNNDGKVTFADYLALEANFGISAYPAGATLLPSSIDGPTGTVPEPTAVALLIVGGIGIWRPERAAKRRF